MKIEVSFEDLKEGIREELGILPILSTAEELQETMVWLITREEKKGKNWSNVELHVLEFEKDRVVLSLTDRVPGYGAEVISYIAQLARKR